MSTRSSARSTKRGVSTAPLDDRSSIKSFTFDAIPENASRASTSLRHGSFWSSNVSGSNKNNAIFVCYRVYISRVMGDTGQVCRYNRGGAELSFDSVFN